MVTKPRTQRTGNSGGKLHHSCALYIQVFNQWYSTSVYQSVVFEVVSGGICRMPNPLPPGSEIRNIIQQTVIGDSKACFLVLEKALLSTLSLFTLGF